MDEIEKRAIALLASEYESSGLAGVAMHLRRAASLADLSVDERATLRAISAALRSAQVPEWRPIETAPEGSWFLAHSERGWIGVVRRADPDYAPDEGWFEDEHGEYVHPAWLTHWMPLPAAPTVSAEREG